MEMSGLQALKAGNDMVLAPRNLKEEIAAVLDAIDKGELTREDIEEKCRKVLTYKYVLGLKKKPFVQLSGLGQRINTPQTRDLIRRLNLAAITVLNNEIMFFLCIRIKKKRWHCLKSVMRVKPMHWRNSCRNTLLCHVSVFVPV